MLSLGDHWTELADLWQFVGPPLRPTSEDTLARERFVCKNYRPDDSGEPRALVLGVTPEIISMNWPQHTRVVAADCNRGMIQNVYPKSSSHRQSVLQSNWLSLPFKEKSFDWIIGDGCYVMLEYDKGYRDLSDSIQRMLKPEGQFIIRFYIQPNDKETPKQVFKELCEGLIWNFHLFKWRLAMSLQDNVYEGIPLRRVWECWADMHLDEKDLSGYLNWPMEEIHTIHAYRSSTKRYTFPTWDEMQTVLSRHFEQIDSHIPSFQCGDRFPTLLFTSNQTHEYETSSNHKKQACAVL